MKNSLPILLWFALASFALSQEALPIEALPIETLPIENLAIEPQPNHTQTQPEKEVPNKPSHAVLVPILPGPIPMISIQDAFDDTKPLPNLCFR